MSGIDKDNSARIKNAEESLARAIGRLEAAFDAQTASADMQQDPGLADEISRLQTENAELRTLVGRASESLDGTIAKLKTQLAG